MSVDVPEIYNPKQIDPALLTFNEYRNIIDDEHKYHEDSSYQVDLKKLNSYRNKSDYKKLLRRFKVNSIEFELRVQIEPNTYYKMDQNGEYIRINGDIVPFTSEEVKLLGKRVYSYELGIFDGEMMVASLTFSEWNCLLVMVAEEYKGFGLGPFITKVGRTMEPGKASGGFTPGGFKNIIKVHREFVRDALRSGLYRQLIKQGTITLDRVKEIIASASLKDNKPRKEINLSSDNPKEWMLYVGESGDVIVYDKKLKDLIENGKVSDYWIDKMIKGLVYVSGNRFQKLMKFGADSPKLRTFLMSCAIEECRTNKEVLYIEGNEYKYVDPAMGTVDPEVTVKAGFKSQKVTPTGKKMDLSGLGNAERAFRKSFDKYDEFKNQMLEMAYGKYDGLTESRKQEKMLSEAVINLETKVVDGSGKPLRVYHGTNADFKTFSQEFFGSNTTATNTSMGFFFTNSSNVAGGFAKKNGGRIIPCYLKMNKPFVIEPSSIDYKMMKTSYEMQYRNDAQPRRHYHAGKDPYHQLYDFVKLVKSDDSSDIITKEDCDSFRNRLIAKGFDGIIVKETYMDAPLGVNSGMHDFYIVFNADQIVNAVSSITENELDGERLDKGDEDDRIFHAFCKKHGINLSDLSDEEINSLYSEAVANRNLYPIPVSDPRYFYHGTAKKNLRDIAENGLRPSINPRTKDSELVSHSLGRVFFTKTITNANFYGLRANKSFSILRVLRSNLKDAKLDDKDTMSVFVERVVPAGQIEAWNGQKWIAIKNKLPIAESIIPKPSRDHVLDAIQHADHSDNGWTPKDFTISYVGYLSVDELEEFDDLSSWTEVNDLDDLEDFRDGNFNVGSDANMPPIIVITAPDEGGCHTQIGDGRGRVNWATAHNAKLHVYHMIHKDCKE